jgi:uncharacterized protein (TIGR03086 family)
VDLADLLRLDATALALIGHDVALIPDSAMANPTPCEGWTVADLLRHMNERHDAVARTVLPPLDRESDDPRADFARITARVMAVFETNETVNIPWRGPEPTARVLGIHVVDMLVHRWDLARALETSPAVPAGLAEAVLPLARANTAPGSPLNGPGGVYRPPVAEDPANSPMDTIVALLGRDPRWSPQITTGS